MSKQWLDRPDREGYWWLRDPNGKWTVGFVDMLANTGMFYVHLIGYREPFNDRDVDTGPLKDMKWKWLPRS